MLRNIVRNSYYFLRGYDADRFAAPKFYIREVKDLIKLGNYEAPIRIIVSRKKCRWNAGFKFNSNVHPFVATMKSGNITYLERFYHNYQPKNILEMYFLPSNEKLSIVSFPWKKIKTKAELNENDGLSDNAGNQWFGPVSPEKIEVEYKRCMNCYLSIKKDGYFPQKYGGYPRGHFLVSENDFCFQVDGGQHRLAALSALEWNRIEVMSMNRPLKLIHKSEVDQWPAVREGYISKEDALAIFNLHLTNGTCKNQLNLLRQY